MGDQCKLMRPKAPRVRDKCGRQGGDNCKLMRPKAPRVGDKGETSVNSCGPRNPEWETSLGDKCGRQAWETSGEFTLVSPLSPTLGALGRMSLHLSPSCLPHLSPTLVSHSGFLGPHEFTLVSPLSPTLVSHSGCLGPHEFRLVSHSGFLGPHKGNKCKLMRPKKPRVGDKCGRQVWETRGRQVQTHAAQGTQSGRQGGDKCKLMRPKEPRVGDKSKLMRPEAPRVGDKCGRQGGDKCKLMQLKKPRVGDKGERSVNSCGPRNPEWETSVGDKWGVLHLSPGCLGPHEFNTCLPLVSHSGCLGPHEFTLVSPLSPTLVPWAA